MTNFFLAVISVSITTGLLAAVLMVLLPLLRNRYKAKLSYYIWIILAVQLLLPVGGQAVSELFQWSRTLSASGQNAASDQPEHKPHQQVVIKLPAVITMPVASPAPDKEGFTLLTITEYIWLTGCIAIFSFSIYSYHVYRKKLLKYAHTEEDEIVHIQIQRLKKELHIHWKFTVLMCMEEISPMVIGIFRPTLVLPKNHYSEEELYFILKHELIHMKRHDVAIKLLFLAAGAIHWFNPLVYMMRRRAEVDMELSCDEQTICNAAYGERKAYAETLFSTIQAASDRRTSMSTQFYGGKEVMKKRFQNIFTKTRKKSGWYLLMCTAILTATAGILIGCDTAKTDSGIIRASDAGTEWPEKPFEANPLTVPKTEKQTGKQQESADTRASALPKQDTNTNKKIFQYDSKFLKQNIASALKEIGVKESYEYKVISHKYNSKIKRISYYVQIRVGESDSFDYLTISFLKGSNGWMAEEYYLEK